MNRKNVVITIILILLGIALILATNKLDITKTGLAIGNNDSDKSIQEWKGRSVFIVHSVDKYEIDLNKYLVSKTNQTLRYKIQSNLNTEIKNNTLIFYPEEGDRGIQKLTIYSTDDINEIAKELTFYVYGDLLQKQKLNSKVESQVEEEIYRKAKAKVIVVLKEEGIETVEAQKTTKQETDTESKERVEKSIERRKDNLEGMKKKVLSNIIVDNSSLENRTVKEERSLNKQDKDATNPLSNIIGAAVTKLEPEAELVLTQDYATLNVIAGEVTQEGLEKLEENDLVEKIYLDPVMGINLLESKEIINANNLIINLNEQSINKKDNQNNTEEIQSNKKSVKLTGSGESVCLLDTGVDAGHEALQDKVVAQQCFCSISDLGEGGCCSNGETTDIIAEDDSINSHGTHVAGIVAAGGPNSEVEGVAPRVNIVAVKVCDFQGKCLGSDILAGIDYCNANSPTHNIGVISGSLSDSEEYTKDTCPSPFDNSFEVARQLSISTIFAAGNNYHTKGISYPACSPYTISVGASDKQNNHAEFSNRDDETENSPDVLAPGVKIRSTTRDNNYNELTGTSQSTPQVAGAIALIKERNRLLNVTKNHAEIKEALKQTGKLSNQGNNVIIDTGAAIAAIDSIEIEETSYLTTGIQETEGFGVTNSGSGTQCGGINESITLTANISTTGNVCYTVNASNIFIDGAGFYILDHEVGSTTAFSITNFRNITIKNLKIINFSTAINGVNASNVTIWNNTFNGSNVLIVFNPNGTYTNISQNNLTNTKIRLHLESSLSTIEYNTMSTSADTAIEISLRTDNVTVRWNNITTTNGKTGIRFGGVGAVFGNGGQRHKVLHNKIRSVGVGIMVDEANETEIAYNNITSIRNDRSTILYESQASFYINITNNTITTNGSNTGAQQVYAINFEDNGLKHGVVHANKITATGNGSGILISTAFVNFSDNIILASGDSDSHGIVLEGADTENNTFTNDRINSTNFSEIYIIQADYTSFKNIILMNNENISVSNIKNSEISIRVNESPQADPSDKQNLSDYIIVTNTGNTLEYVEQINFSYLDSEMVGLTENTAKLYLFNGSTGAWEAIPGSTVDTTANVIVSGNLTPFIFNKNYTLATFADNAASATPVTPTGGAGAKGSSTGEISPTQTAEKTTPETPTYKTTAESKETATQKTTELKDSTTAQTQPTEQVTEPQTAIQKIASLFTPNKRVTIRGGNTGAPAWLRAAPILFLPTPIITGIPLLNSLLVVEEEQIEPVCEDTDGGKNIFEEGGTRQNSETKIYDQCFKRTLDWRGTGYQFSRFFDCRGEDCYVEERWCEDSQIKRDKIKCPGDCYDGACKPQKAPIVQAIFPPVFNEQSCIDLDGGNEPLFFGIATGYLNDDIDTEIRDSCLDKNTIKEGICISDTAQTIEVFCPDGTACSEGECIEVNELECTDEEKASPEYPGNSCSDIVTLQKTYCDHGKEGLEKYQIQKELCPYGCNEGACLTIKEGIKLLGGDENFINRLECLDSQKDPNKFVRGIAFRGSSSYKDTCIGEQLTDYYCSDDGTIAAERTKCEDGCEDGVCLGDNVTTTLSFCKDSDGNNTKEAGRVEWPTETGVSFATDSCDGFTRVNEQLCEDNKGRKISLPCESGTTCVKGACIPQTQAECLDTDGKDPTVRGDIQWRTDAGLAKDYDRCLNKDFVMERTCEKGGRKTTMVPCTEGTSCREGACVSQEEIQCVDSDGENSSTVSHSEIIIKGIQTRSEVESCTDNSTVKEFVCENKELIEKDIKCKKGEMCFEGACINSSKIKCKGEHTEDIADDSCLIEGQGIIEQIYNQLVTEGLLDSQLSEKGEAPKVMIESTYKELLNKDKLPVQEVDQDIQKMSSSINLCDDCKIATATLGVGGDEEKALVIQAGEPVSSEDKERLNYNINFFLNAKDASAAKTLIEKISEKLSEAGVLRFSIVTHSHPKSYESPGSLTVRSYAEDINEVSAVLESIASRYSSFLTNEDVPFAKKLGTGLYGGQAKLSTSNKGSTESLDYHEDRARALAKGIKNAYAKGIIDPEGIEKEVKKAFEEAFINFEKPWLHVNAKKDIFEAGIAVPTLMKPFIQQPAAQEIPSFRLSKPGDSATWNFQDDAPSIKITELPYNLGDHTITFIKTENGKATFEIRSEHQIITVTAGQTVNVNLNNDDGEDVSVTVNSITGRGGGGVSTTITILSGEDTEEPVEETIYCYNSDASQNYNSESGGDPFAEIMEEGYAIEYNDEDNILKAINDSCVSESILSEATCDGNSATSIEGPCPGGSVCSEGKCIADPSAVPSAQIFNCVDHDEGINSQFISSRINYDNTHGPQEETDVCVGQTHLIERKCSPGDRYEQINCEYGCKEGRCLDITEGILHIVHGGDWCEDPDGPDLTVAGTTRFSSTTQELVLSDLCYYGKIREYTCSADNREYKYEDLDCPEGTVCSDGACKEQRWCQDDDGVDVSIKGINRYNIQGNSYSKQDSCKDENTLIEYSCNGAFNVEQEIGCGDGERCIAGRCMDIAPVQKTLECIDTDGNSPFAVGKAGYGSNGLLLPQDSSIEDRCDDENTLQEAVCGDQGFAYEENHCDYGCFRGACLDPTSLTCLDTDGDDKYKVGLGRLTGDRGYLKKHADYCLDEDSVMESSCIDTRLKITKIGCESNEKCINGLCAPKSPFVCIDTDGNNKMFKGQAGNEADVCVVSASGIGGVLGAKDPINECAGDDCFVREQSCSFNIVVHEDLPCDNGCIDGACRETEPEYHCVETDGGSEDYTSKGGVYLQVGSVHHSPDIVEDSCVNNVRLKETYCDLDETGEDQINYLEIDCIYGCNDGACAYSDPNLGHCEDSDAGINIYSEGSVSQNGFQTKGDYCKDDNTLVENTCNYSNVGGDQRSSVEVDCPRGCEEGRCRFNANIDSCIDSDGGANALEKGETEHYNGANKRIKVQDSCDSSIVLRESICVESETGTSYISSVPITCLHGCSEGKCNTEREFKIKQHQCTEDIMVLEELDRCYVLNQNKIEYVPSCGPGDNCKIEKSKCTVGEVVPTYGQCTLGCNNGKCIEEERPEPIDCSGKPDGRVAEDRDKCHIITKEVGTQLNYVTQCAGEFCGIELNYCQDQEHIKMYGSERYGCVDGKKISQSERTDCVDSEAGSNHYVHGTVNINTGDPFTSSSVSDACIGDDLREYSCGSTGLNYETIQCAEGCNEGACNPEVCRDSDGGKDYEFAGDTTLGSEIFTDGCTEDGKKYREYYCKDNRVRTEEVECELGCENGRCIESGAPVLPLTGGDCFSIIGDDVGLQLAPGECKDEDGEDIFTSSLVRVRPLEWGPISQYIEDGCALYDQDLANQLANQGDQPNNFPPTGGCPTSVNYNNGIYEPTPYKTVTSCSGEDCYVKEAICSQANSVNTVDYKYIGCPEGNSCRNGACVDPEELVVIYGLPKFQVGCPEGLDEQYCREFPHTSKLVCPADTILVDHTSFSFGGDYPYIDGGLKGETPEISRGEVTWKYFMTKESIEKSREDDKLYTVGFQNILECLEKAPDIVCEDSDGGNDIFEEGKVKIKKENTEYGRTSKKDRCEGTRQGRQVVWDKVREYYCEDDGNYGVEVRSCPEGTLCGNDACVPTGDLCYDTDAGEEELIKGRVYVQQQEKGEDTCYDNSNNINVDDCSGSNCYVKEYYCDDIGTQNKLIKCDNGCRDGACLFELPEGLATITGTIKNKKEIIEESFYQYYPVEWHHPKHEEWTNSILETISLECPEGSVKIDETSIIDLENTGDWWELVGPPVPRDTNGVLDPIKRETANGIEWHISGRGNSLYIDANFQLECEYLDDYTIKVGQLNEKTITDTLNYGQDFGLEEYMGSIKQTLWCPQDYELIESSNTDIEVVGFAKSQKVEYPNQAAWSYELLQTGRTKLLANHRIKCKQIGSRDIDTPEYEVLDNNMKEKLDKYVGEEITMDVLVKEERVEVVEIKN